jgi:hypothetical protein
MDFLDLPDNVRFEIVMHLDGYSTRAFFCSCKSTKYFEKLKKKEFEQIALDCRTTKTREIRLLLTKAMLDNYYIINAFENRKEDKIKFRKCVNVVITSFDESFLSLFKKVFNQYPDLEYTISKFYSEYGSLL